MATVTAYIVMNQIWPYYHRTIIMVSRLDMDNNLGSHQSLVVFYEFDLLSHFRYRVITTRKGYTHM